MQRDPFSEQGLPSDVNTEKSILGAISLNPELLTQALAVLETADFYLGSHRQIFDVMISLQQRGKPIDNVTLPSLLNDRKQLEQVGGISYLASLIDGVPQTDNIEYYCQIIKNKARERKAITLLDHSITELIDGEDELDVILERVRSRLANIDAGGDKNQAITGVYDTLDDLFSAQIDEPEQILFGLHRGEVAGLFAVTNYGKTTLLYNTVLSIAAGQTLWPLAPIVPKPRRILYIDSESPASRSRDDLKTIIAHLSDGKEARKNFAIVLDASINGVSLNLIRTDHFKWLIAIAKEYKADLVIIDTAASAFELQDENSNAEVTRRVMNPLKQLAREANCAVIFTHHIGKANETQSGEASYKGRGASAFGALSRTTFTIEKDAKKGMEYVVLTCPKVKGQAFQPVLLKLNRETRWFEVCSDNPSAKPEPPTAHEIAEFVKKRVEARSGEICEHFKRRAGTRTIEDRIREADYLELIYKANQKAPWRFGNGKNGDSGDSPEAAAESTDSVFPQSASPIRGCGNAETNLKGESETGYAYCSTCGAAGLPCTHCERCGEFLRG